MNAQPKTLLNLHEVMVDARIMEEGEHLVPLQVRVPKDIRDKAHLICAGNSTCLTNFVRAAIFQLVKEYGGVS